MAYSPDKLVLMLSRRCNAACDHCIVDAGPGFTEKLSKESVDRTVREAGANGFNTLIPYGGEPFLFINDLLPYTIRAGLEEGMSISIGTNGFWGSTETMANKVLSEMEEIAATYDRVINIALSVDKYHQTTIPTKSISRIITQHKQGEFNHVSLNIQTFKDQKSWDVW